MKTGRAGRSFDLRCRSLLGTLPRTHFRGRPWLRPGGRCASGDTRKPWQGHFRGIVGNDVIVRTTVSWPLATRRTPCSVPTMDTKPFSIRTPDGRDLRIESGGDASGRPVLVHGGSPNSRHLADSWFADAEGRGIHLISYDRPGYGGSTAQPGRNVADCASDVRAIAGARRYRQDGGVGVLGRWSRTR